MSEPAPAASARAPAGTVKRKVVSADVGPICGMTVLAVSERLGRPKRLPAYGCSSSIATALGAVDECSARLALLLGDQPGVTPATVEALPAQRGDAPLAVCRYDGGRGHSFAFDRRMFDGLATLQGDKGVRRPLDERADDVVQIAVAGPVPLDMDTPEDYEAVLAAAGFVEARA